LDQAILNLNAVLKKFAVQDERDAIRAEQAALAEREAARWKRKSEPKPRPLSVFSEGTSAAIAGLGAQLSTDVGPRSRHERAELVLERIMYFDSAAGAEVLRLIEGNGYWSVERAVAKLLQ
jgi:hypothetical protein